MDLRDRVTALGALVMLAALSCKSQNAAAQEVAEPAAASGSEAPPAEPVPEGCGVALSGTDITAETPCSVVGVHVLDRLRTDACAVSEPPAEAIEPPKPETLGAQGSPAQLAAAPSIATTPLAGGALARGATGAGPRLVRQHPRRPPSSCCRGRSVSSIANGLVQASYHAGKPLRCHRLRVRTHG